MNLADLVATAAADAAQRPALLTPDGEARTWGGLEDRVAAVAGALRDRLGVQPGDVVGVCFPNTIAFTEAYWGVLRAGGIVVPVNPAYTPPEIAHLLTDSGAVLALADPRLSSTVEAARAAARVVPFSAGDLDEADPQPSAPTGGDDCAVICYTSGTTGKPKGARLTHANFLANLESFSQLPLLTFHDHDVLLGVLPFFHIFGLNVILNAAARHHAAVLVLERFSPAGSLDAMARAAVTVAYGAPPVYAAWNAVPGGQRPELPRLRAAVSGADALPVPVWQQFAEGYGVEILEGYGLTEAAPVLTSNAASPSVRPGTVGHRLPGVDVMVLDPSGAQAEAGQTGEIVARGPNIFTGYHGESEATAEVLRDGWLHTGDLGSLDDDGYLTIAGRLKDLIIVSGFNVYPREVEQALLAHPEVADAAVVGAPDRRTGERVRALVVPAPGSSPSPEQLLDHCRTRLARYKLPRDVQVVAELPRLPSGKLQRSALTD
jgi:long-chain acyl-CoA synthetase